MAESIWDAMQRRENLVKGGVFPTESDSELQDHHEKVSVQRPNSAEHKRVTKEMDARDLTYGAKARRPKGWGRSRYTAPAVLKSLDALAAELGLERGPQTEALVKELLLKAADPNAFLPKDTMRIDGIIAGGKGDKAHEELLARRMAAKITDPNKAYRRARAAEDQNYHHVAGHFFDRATALGHSE